jgi:hypothetical protein
VYTRLISMKAERKLLADKKADLVGSACFFIRFDLELCSSFVQIKQLPAVEAI